MKGAEDKEVLEYAVNQNLIMITFDDDFTKFGKETHPEIIHITRRADYSKVAATIKELLQAPDQQDLENEVFMVSP